MERPVDELVERILGACADGARGNAAQIISEATREAQEEVKSLVKSAMKAALLREAAAALENSGAPLAAWTSDHEELQTPEQTSEKEGWYVYGFSRASGADLRDLRGVTDDALEFIEHGGVAAVVNRVPLDAFDDAMKDEASQNLRWLEEKARAHDAVLKGLLSAGPVVPLRFCTILRSGDDVRELLARHRDVIARTLEAFDGKREWGVKIMFDESCALRAGTEDAGGAGGRDYLLHKKRRRDERGEALRAARAQAAECQRQLAAIAADAVTLPTRRAGEFAEPMQLLQNGAYLVADAHLDRFRSLVDEFSERNRDVGLALEMTGPWPAYNFVRLDLSMEAAA